MYSTQGAHRLELLLQKTSIYRAKLGLSWHLGVF